MLTRYVRIAKLFSTQWHYLVVDLVEANAAANTTTYPNKFAPDANGKYAIKYLRVDLTTVAMDGSCYLDIASINFADQADAVSKYIETTEE